MFARQHWFRIYVLVVITATLLLAITEQVWR